MPTIRLGVWGSSPVSSVCGTSWRGTKGCSRTWVSVTCMGDPEGSTCWLQPGLVLQCGPLKSELTQTNFSCPLVFKSNENKQSFLKNWLNVFNEKEKFMLLLFSFPASDWQKFWWQRFSDRIGKWNSSLWVSMASFQLFPPSACPDHECSSVYLENV